MPLSIFLILRLPRTHARHAATKRHFPQIRRTAAMIDC